MWVLDQKRTSLYEVDSVHAIDTKVWGMCAGQMVILGEYTNNKKARDVISLVVYMLKNDGADQTNYLYRMYREDENGELTL